MKYKTITYKNNTKKSCKSKWKIIEKWGSKSLTNLEEQTNKIIMKTIATKLTFFLKVVEGLNYDEHIVHPDTHHQEGDDRVQGGEQQTQSLIYR